MRRYHDEPGILPWGMMMPGTIIKTGALLLLTMLWSARAIAVPDCEWPDDKALEAILPVATDHGSHASGVVVAKNHVLTAAHAIEGGGQFFVRVANGFRAAKLIVIDHRADLAVLSVDTGTIQPLPVAWSEPTEQQQVWAVGFPRAQGKTTSAGIFQRNRQGALHTSAPIDSGQSGGGLLTCEQGSYHLLGMLRGYGAYLSGDHYVKLQNHSVSVAAATIHRFIGTYQ